MTPYAFEIPPPLGVAGVVGDDLLAVQLEDQLQQMSRHAVGFGVQLGGQFAYPGLALGEHVRQELAHVAFRQRRRGGGGRVWSRVAAGRTAKDPAVPAKTPAADGAARRPCSGDAPDRPRAAGRHLRSSRTAGAGSWPAARGSRRWPEPRAPARHRRRAAPPAGAAPARRRPRQTRLAGASSFQPIDQRLAFRRGQRQRLADQQPQQLEPQAGAVPVRAASEPDAGREHAALARFPRQRVAAAPSCPCRRRR